MVLLNHHVLVLDYLQRFINADTKTNKKSERVQQPWSESRTCLFRTFSAEYPAARRKKLPDGINPFTYLGLWAVETQRVSAVLRELRLMVSEWAPCAQL